MDRRSMLKQIAFTGAAAWLPPFQVDGAAQAITDQYAGSVPFLQDPSLTGLTPQDLQNLFTVNGGASAAAQSAAFPQSLASGDPRPNGIVLWTRVDQSAQGGNYPEIVAWQISKDDTFDQASLVLEGIAALDATHDNTVKLPLANTALQSYTNYYYRFIYNSISSRTGRLKTLPAEDATLTQLKLGYSVCQDFGNGYYTALHYLAQEDIEYIVFLGDYIYETINDVAFQNNPARTVPPFPSGGSIPQNLDDYRHLYKTYRSDANLQATHELFSYIFLWDDHEFANDCHQDFHPDDNVSPNSATTPQPALRQAANQAWSEYGLANTPFDGSVDWEHSIQLYRTFRFGTLAELIITDQRLYRDGPPCGNTEFGERYFTAGCLELLNPTRTMLGSDQKTWFLQKATTSAATWKLWANEVMLMQLKAALIFIDLDQWDGYPMERAQILSAIEKAGVKNFVALTGDLHTFLAGYLKKDFNNLLESPMGVELMVGSITSANFAEEIEAAVSLPSAPVPAKKMGVPPNLLDPVVRAANPHIQYWDSSSHGYGVLTLTPQQLTCEFKAVTTIREPTANLVSLKTFTIPVNQVKLILS